MVRLVISKSFGHIVDAPSYHPWLIVVHGKGNNYRLIPMNSQVRDPFESLS